MDQDTYHGKLFLIGISTVITIVFIILIGIVIIVLRARNAAPAPSVTNSAPQPTQRAQANVGNGEMFLQLEPSAASHKVGDTITIDVYLSSDSSQLIAYDAEILFDSLSSFVSAKSLLPEFDVRSTVKENRVFVTGFKKLNDTKQSVFAQTPAARLTFTLKGKGTAVFTPQFVPGETTHSNLIDVESKNILGQVKGVEIIVE